MPWAAFAFWPATIVAILLGVFGVRGRRWKWVVAGLLAGSPFLLYLSATPRFGWVAVLVATAYAGAVVATFRQRGRLAWCLFTPMVLLVVYVASMVATIRFR